VAINSYDVLVAGAGPAGNIAALKLAELGHHVGVVDFRTKIGDKLCTGIIGRECADLYPPDPADIYHTAQSAVLVAPSGRSHSVERDEPHAYIVNRVNYVASLAKRAQDCGAEFRLGEKIEAINQAHDGVSIHTTSQDGSRQIDAKAVVIASGFASPLVRMVGLQNTQPKHNMIGCQAVVSTSDLDRTEVYLGESIVPGSFAWLVPVSQDTGLVGLVSRHKLNGHMDHFIERLQAQGKVHEVVQEPKRWGIPIKPLSKTYANRVIVAGDAAGQVKPTTGGGIYYAILSGELAAQTLDEALKEGDLSEQSTSGYENSWRRLFGRELKVGYYARRFYETLSDRHIEAGLEKLLSDSVQGELIGSKDFSFDWHSSLVMKAVMNSELRQAISSLGPIAEPLLSRIRSSS